MPTNPRHSIPQRLREIYRRLQCLPNANTAEEAFSQLCQTLEQVEDELSGIEKATPAPPLGSSDGRMYCPMEDHVHRPQDGSILALTRGHRIEVSASGRLQIVNKVTKTIEFSK